MKSTRIDKALTLSPLEGVEMAILGSGDNMTLIRITVQPGARFPEHSHPNEQIGTCLKGEGELISGGKSIKVEPGVSWTIPADEPHSFVAKGSLPAIIHEAWSPPREDYLSMAKKG